MGAVKNQKAHLIDELFQAGPTRLELATSCVTGKIDKNFSLKVAIFE
jgi:hypothetical protein